MIVTKEVQVRALADGFTALIHPYQSRLVGGHMGTQIWDLCNLVEIVRDYGTDRQSTWASELVLAGTKYEPQTRNKGGTLGAYVNVRPTEERIAASTAELLTAATARWVEAQDHVWVIAVDKYPRGMVRTPLSQHAIEDAVAAGTAPNHLLQDDDTRDTYVEVIPLQEAWIQFGLQAWEEYRSDVQRLLLSVIRNRCGAMERETGTQMAWIGFEQRVKRADSYEMFAPIAIEALTWLQGGSTEWPAGVETGPDFRRRYWGPNSPYSRV